MIKYTLLLLLLGLNFMVYAQDYPEIYRPKKEGGFDMLPGHLVQFRTADAEKAVFSLSFDSDNWKRFTVYQSEPLTISLKKYTSTYFRICTSEAAGCVSYKLKGSELYRVYWNRDTRKWDLLKVEQ